MITVPLAGQAHLVPQRPKAGAEPADGLALSGGVFSGEQSLLSHPNQLTDLRFDRRAGHSRLSLLAGIRQYKTKADTSASSRRTMGLLAENALAYLAAGNRFLPGPHTDFLRDRSFFSGLEEVPAPRRVQTLFFQALPNTFCPGIFYVEGSRSPGWFVRSPDDSLLAAWHGATRSGVVAVHKSWAGKEQTHELRADVIRENQTTEGSFFFHSLSEDSDKAYLRASIVRRASWDALDGAGRKGKSGSAAAAGGPAAWLVLEAAGEDRGLHAARLGGIEMRVPAVPLPGRAVARARSIQESRFDGEVRRLYNRPGIGGGWIFGSESGSFLRLVFDSERHGVHKGELVAAARMDGISGEIGFLGRDFPGRPAVMYRFREEDAYGRGLFSFDEHSALFVTIKSRFLYLYVSTTWAARSRNTYAALQVRLTL